MVWRLEVAPGIVAHLSDEEHVDGLVDRQPTRLSKASDHDLDGSIGLARTQSRARHHHARHGAAGRLGEVKVALRVQGKAEDLRQGRDDLVQVRSVER